MKHSFQSHTLRSKAEGESAEESISSEEEEDELNREKMMLRKEKVRAELEAEIARDIWREQISEEVKRDCDKWKGFGADPSSSEKNVDKADKNGEMILREQHICLSLVGVLFVVCLILYGVLLYFAVKASSCWYLYRLSTLWNM